MKINQNEFLSAVLDDEAGEFERRRLLDELCDDTALGETLSRYSLVGEAMRSQQLTVVNSGSFLAGIQSQLADEPVYQEVMVSAATNNVVQGGNQDSTQKAGGSAEQITTEQPWYRANTARYAVAASVAVAALAGVLVLQNDVSQPEVSDTLALQESTTPVGAEISAEVVTLAASESMTDAADTVVQAATSTPVTLAANSNRLMALADAGRTRQNVDTLTQYVTLHMQYRSSNGIAPSIQAVSYAK